MKRAIFAAIILFTGSNYPITAQGLGQPMFPGATQAETSVPPASDPAQPFLEMGKEMISSRKFSESKEALRTALRLAPMNLQLWSMYDEAVIGEFSERRRQDKLSPIIDRDIIPVFSIDRVDSYNELGTLYVIGEIKNISGADRANIEITARILDENQRELRRETGTLRSSERGLFANESALFEVPFRNPPPGAKSFRVEVSSYD